ncbi:hypothetical protein, variant 1 [Aphanomyces invadans]|uniref:USP domain-containing protein n=1 Tax=Aphanomyces invadans TaxID=157072 RepID=A0A024U4D3_9STRA|nr:hypothetical protein, variant 1 [Aphanomyces invadans]ETW00757.1 hypothetical protein, variant 1 [Aphanomyces invadans]|eukprot:XP_008870892.1 hypothetical protein, variant 1 [Aphanomyces invadans]
MEQTLDGRAAKNPPSTHVFHLGGLSTAKSQPSGATMDGGYNPPGNPAVSNKLPSPRHIHHQQHHGDVYLAKVKADAPAASGGAYYAAPSSSHSSIQPPYNPNVMHGNSSGKRYYNPHLINPPLPPLPPTNTTPLNPVPTPTSMYPKPSPSDSFHRPVQDATYHRPPQSNHVNTVSHHRHPSSAPLPSSSHNMEQVKCHRCGDKGHIAPSCPSRRSHHHSSYSKHQPRTCKYWLNGNCHKGDDCTFVHALVPDANGLYYPPHMLRHTHQGTMYPPMDQTFYYPPPPVPQHHVGYGYDPNIHHIALGSDDAYEYQQPSEVYPGPSVAQAGYGGAPYYPYDTSYGHYQYPGQRYATPPAPAVYHPQQQPPPPPPHHHATSTHPAKMYNYPQPHHHSTPRNNFAHPYPTDPAALGQPPYNSPVTRTSPPDSFQGCVDDVSELVTSFAHADVNAAPSVAFEVPAVVSAAPLSKENANVASALAETTPLDDKPPSTVSIQRSTSKSSVASPTDVSGKGTKKKKKAKPMQSLSLTLPPLTEKGLRNDSGENNCFLNVVVQALFHLETFQSRWTETTAVPHECAGDGRCVYCSLASVFALLASDADGESDKTGGVSSDSLRKVLSAISTSPLPAAEERYKAGSMDDAAEAHETILRSLHEALASSSVASPCNCLAHSVFGLWVGEEAVCPLCQTSMATPPYDAMMLHVATEAIKESAANKSKVSNKAVVKRFDDLLATVWAAAGSSKKCTTCRHDKVYESRLQLKQVPRVFTVGLTWKNNSANMATLKSIVTAMECSVRLGRVFPNMVADGQLGGPDEGQATLLAMYCFFGHHYMAFIYKAATQEWLSFNDTVVRRVGTRWSDVQAACLEVRSRRVEIFRGGE